MSKISIVTAFYDIGRGDWSTNTEKNGGPLPHYLQRSVDKYLDHFKRMCEIDTEIIVYTSPDIAPRLAAISLNVKVVELATQQSQLDKMDNEINDIIDGLV